MTVIQVKPEDIIQKQWLSYQKVRGTHGNAKPSAVHNNFQGVPSALGQHQSSRHTSLEHMRTFADLASGRGRCNPVASLQLLREDYLEHRTLYEAVQSIVSERARQHPVAILDLGCGDSDYVARMLEAAGGGDIVESYTGVDLSEPAMAISMRNIERWIYHDALCHSLLHMDHAHAWKPLFPLLTEDRLPEVCSPGAKLLRAALRLARGSMPGLAHDLLEYSLSRRLQCE